MTGAALVVLILLSGIPVGAQSPPGHAVTASVRIPAESYVGDPVELRYTIRTRLDIRVPEENPAPSWGRVDSVRLLGRGDDHELRIVLVPFEPGTLTLPRLPLGEVVLEGLSINVKSVLEPHSSLQPVFPPVRLPGTGALLSGAVFGVVFLAAAALYLTGPGRRHLGALARRYRSGVPYRRLERALRDLQTRLSSESARQFYIDLVSALQAYVGGRLGCDCRALTSTELTERLPLLEAACGAPAAAARELSEVLETADAAKFAGAPIRRKMRSRHVELVRAVVVGLERSRRARRRGATAQARNEMADVGA